MYSALYRKWRPKVFSDVVGQQAVVITLQNQVKSNKLSHAYLFTGFKGTGKTSCAKILAKAVNCKNPINGNPCNECEICKGIETGSIMDVLEIDAASNNGVENIRDLRQEANFTPSAGKYRVYIIDEAHMLSIGAFNALLKIMEEPPKYVMFILATTEANKIPATILSRCQQFRFNKINQADIAKSLLNIAQSEKIKLSEKAANGISRFSDGALRDALSILDSCISYVPKGEIDIETVFKVVAISNQEDILKLVQSIINKDVKLSLEIVDLMVSNSVEPYRLMESLIKTYRNIMLVKTSGNKNLLGLDEEEYKNLESMSTAIEIGEVIKAIDVLSESYSKMQRVSSKQLELELAIIKINMQKNNSVSDESVSDESVSDEIEESKVRQEVEMLKRQVSKLESEIIKLKTNQNINASKKSNNLSIDIETVDEVLYEQAEEVKNWSEVLDIFSKTNPALNAALQGSKGYVNNKAEIVFIDAQNQFFLDLIRSSSQAKATLKESIEKVLGKKYRIGPYKSKATNSVKVNEFIKDIENKAKENGVNLDCIQ